MSTHSYTTQKALALLADRGIVTTARVLRNIEKQLDLHVQRDGSSDSDSDDQGVRLYTPADLDLLEKVLVLQKAGLHLVEIRAILIEHDRYLLEFAANGLRRALDLLAELARNGHSPAA